MPRRPASRLLLTTLLIALGLLLAGCPGRSDTPADGGGDGAAPNDVTPRDASPDGALNIAPGCNPLAVTDDCLMPYPNDFMTTADSTTRTGRRLALPAGALRIPENVPPIDLAPFTRGDGAPSSAPIMLHLGVSLATDALYGSDQTARSLAADAPIAVFNAATGARVPYLSEMDLTARRDRSRAALFIRPMVPLDFGARYVVALRRTLRAADGNDLPPSRGFAALRDNTPTDEPRVEAARARYEQLFAFLAQHGFARQDLYLAWDFTTASEDHVLGPIRAMRQAVFAAASAGTLRYSITSVQDHPNADTARIVLGEFTPPNYLRADNTLVFGADGLPVPQTDRAPSYPFTLVIPARLATDPTPLPLVLFGHGIFGTGRGYLVSDGPNTIQQMANRAGAVVVGTDWIGLSGPDRDLILQQVVPDLNRINLVTDRLVQSLVNNLALIELATGPMADDPMIQLNGARPVDRTRVNYFGVSLGGIQGTSLVSISRHVERAVLAVPGGSWSNMLPRSYVYVPIKTLVDATYPDPLTQTEFIALLQARFDFSDPINLGRMMFALRPSDAPASRRVILQEAIGDCQVPNLVTAMLARTLGVRQMNPAAEAIYGLEAATSPTDQSVIAQYAIPNLLANYRPPMDNTLPTMDNGTHSGIVTLPNALDQVVDLFQNGQVVQHCSGACDPD